MPQAVLDENVSLQVGEVLSRYNYEVLAIAKQSPRGISDPAVFANAVEPCSLLVTRDTHFTNPIRFPPAQTAGILFLDEGNLTSQEEAALMAQFLQTHPPATFAGRLVILSSHGARIR